MNEQIKKYCIRPSIKGYTVNEIASDSFQLQDGEYVVSLEESGLNRWNDQTAKISFDTEGEFLTFNNWQIPKTIELDFHHRGSYESTRMCIVCISPDGLKVVLNFHEDTVERPIIQYFISKLWITMCKDAAELDKYYPVEYGIADKDIARVFRSLAYLKKTKESYPDDGNFKIKWAIEEEYDRRLSKLLKIAIKE